MYFEKTTNGIEYTDDIVSSAGAQFILYPTKDHTPEMIKQAITEIKNNRDVVYLWVAKDKDWNERYRSEIFRHPFVSHLRWYEINADSPIVLQHHRQQETPIAEYITRFVLPCVWETKARNLKQFGDRILKY